MESLAVYVYVLGAEDLLRFFEMAERYFLLAREFD
jgi:hypothetical protein